MKEQFLAVITSGQEQRVWQRSLSAGIFPATSPQKVCLESVLVWTRFRQNTPSLWGHTLLTHLVCNNIIHYLRMYECDVSITLSKFENITFFIHNLAYSPAGKCVDQI